MKHNYSILIPSSRQEVDSLVQKHWLPQRQKTVLCVDSYHSGALRGRLYGPDSREHTFTSLSGFLKAMDALLDAETLCVASPVSLPGSIRKGKQATFELQVLFRQHASWQGVILWKEQQRRQNFRSVLELISLIDSALRLPEGREAV